MKLIDLLKEERDPLKQILIFGGVLLYKFADEKRLERHAIAVWEDEGGTLEPSDEA